MDLEVDRTDLRRTRIAPGRPLPDEPPAGHVLCRVDTFALTANNVTYAVVGDLMGYWRFFPSADPGWGRVPVWGHGEVVASSHPDVAPGERYFGYWPMSSHLLVAPADVGPHGLTDGIAHRRDLPAVYNRYQRARPPFDEAVEGRRALLWPLFTTSFVLDDWLQRNEQFGAEALVVSSASSKTALGLADLARRRGHGRVVGLTSHGHVAFVDASGAYDDIVAYDQLPDGLGEGPAVYVDLSGDGSVLGAVHGHFGDALRRSVQVGFTHHDAPQAPVDGPPRPGPEPELFFAPDHVQRATEEWGAAGFAERREAAQAAFEQGAGAAIALDARRGADEVAAAWTEAVDGLADPARGTICSW